MDNELYHFGNWGKGSMRKDHKYIERIKEGNRYRYFYTQAELQAYRLGEGAKSAINTTANKLQNGANRLQTGAKNISQRAGQAANTARANVVRTATSAKNNAVNSANAIADKSLKTIDTARYNANKTASEVSKRIEASTKDVRSMATSKANEAKSSVNRTAKQAKDTAEKMSQQVKDASNKASYAVNRVAKSAIENAQNVANKANQAKNTAIENAQNVANTANQAKNTAFEGARTAVNNVEQTATNAKNRAEDTKANIQKKATEAKEQLSKAIDEANKAFSDDNIYNVNPYNYEQKKQQIMQTDEWKKITSDPNSQYAYIDNNGQRQYNFDEYLLDKKHPALDILKDGGFGRPMEVNQQNLSTVAAGIMDYAEMGRRTVEMALNIGVGLLTFKIMNQQGSLEDEKREIKDKVNNAVNAVQTGLDTYSAVKDAVQNGASLDPRLQQYVDMYNTANQIYNKMNTGQGGNSAVNTATNVAGTVMDEVNKRGGNINAQDLMDIAVKSYAQANGVDEDTARRQMTDTAQSTATNALNRFLGSNGQNVSIPQNSQEMADMAVRAYAQANNMDPDRTSQQFQNGVNTARNVYNTVNQNVNNDQPITPQQAKQMAVQAYAQANGISEAEAQRRLETTAQNTMDYYMNQYR